MKKTALKIFAIILCVTMFFCGCGFNSGIALLRIESSTKTSWKQSHELLTGTEKRTLSLGKEHQEMEIEVVTEKGTIEIKVADKNGEKIILLEDAKTGTYDFTASGKIVITVKADSHKGSFEIRKENS